MSIDFYKEFGELGYLANYSNHGFTVDGVYYPTAEHYYQASKFDDTEIKNKILKCKTPKEASTIGRDRGLKRIDHFSDVKLDKMYEGVYYKFSQNKDIRTKLIETRNSDIREMTVKENYWGVGPNLDGRNEIGKILCKVREQVKKELLDEIISKAKGKKVYIIGHSRPDVDSILSALILTKILRSMGVDAVFAVRDESFSDGEMALDFIDEEYEVVKDYDDKKFILVDHNKLDGIPKENVLGAFDHHRITGEVEDLIEMEYSSCGLLLYDLFKDSYDFSLSEKKYIAYTVLSDTEFLTSSRFSEDDRMLYESLNVDIDVDSLKKKYLKTTSFNLDIGNNFLKDYKEYDYDSLRIKRSTIRSYTEDRKKHYDEYVSAMKKHCINLLIWCDYDELATYICYNGYNLKLIYFFLHI